jgi:uncharacterized protein (DUF1778 family)
LIASYGNLPYNPAMTKHERATRDTSVPAARLEARLPADVLAVLKRAAEIQGRTLTDFVVTAAREAAEHAIKEAQIIKLSIEDQRAIAGALVNPPRPAPALRRAFERHRKLVKSFR